MKTIALSLVFALAVCGAVAAQEHIEPLELTPLAPALGEAQQGTRTPTITLGPSEGLGSAHVMGPNESAYLFSPFAMAQKAQPLLTAAVNAALQQPQAAAIERLTVEIDRLTTDLERLTAENTRLLAEISRLRGRTTQSLISAPSAQQPRFVSETRVRSMVRTWAGAGMLGFGGWRALDGLRLRSACNEARSEADNLRDDLYNDLFGSIANTVDDAVADCANVGTGWMVTGLGLAAVGAMLATVWSDVPAMRNMRSLAVSPLPGGARVTVSYGF